ncbi:MAG: nucleoside deaminase [Anaerolineales bacterium]
MNQQSGWDVELERHLFYLKRAVELAQQARERGNHPFGALLVDEQGNLLLEAENTVVTERDCTAHAETNLVRAACRQYPGELLARCTLYTSTEPCAMCAGAIYWAGIGRVVYALSEAELRQMTGAHIENPTLDLPCREVFRKGQKTIEVIGPIELPEAREVHIRFWDRR